MNFLLILLITLGHLVLHPEFLPRWYQYRPTPGLTAPDGLVLWMIGILVAQSVLWALLWSRQKQSTRGLILAIVISCVALVGSAPLLETDWYRYLWDGIQVSRGVSPYLNPPAILPWDEYARIRGGINFPELATIYPMGAQWIFAFVALLSDADPNIFLALLGLGGFLAVAFAISLLSRRRGVRGSAIALVLFHPLLLREWIQAAHYDSWMMALVLLALSTEGIWTRGLLLGFSVQIKIISLVVALPEVLSLSGRQATRLCQGMLLAIGLLVFSGFMLEGFFIFGESARSWQSFTGVWEMNAGPVRWLRELWMASSGNYDLAREGSRLLMAGAFLAAAGWVSELRRRATRGDGGSGLEALSQEEGAFVLLFFVTWLSPVFNTWYVTWGLILLPFLRSNWSIALAWGVVPVAFGDFFYILGRTPLFPIERWWDLEHLWISLAVLWALCSKAGLLQGRADASRGFMKED